VWLAPADDLDTVASDRPRRHRPSVEGRRLMNIYVGNIAFDVTEADLRAAFEAFGAVASVNLIKAQQEGMCDQT
jgi:RNA recognition motif-containing protein